MDVEYAPYLMTERSVFRMDFLLIDASLSTSEIRPLNLSVPGKGGIRTKTSPARMSARDNTSLSSSVNTTPKKNNENEENKKEITAPNSPELTNDKNRTPKASIESPSKGNLARRSPPEVKENKENEATNKPRDSLDHNFNFALDGYYLLPLNTKVCAQMIVTVEETKSGSTLFKLHPPEDCVEKKVLLSAELKGNTMQSPINIYYNEQLVGEFVYNSSNNSYHIGLTGLSPPVEACAILFNPSFNSPTQPRIFDFVIPALKKHQAYGRNLMYRIPFAEQSTLIMCISRMAKESIRLKSRIPPNKGNSYNMTFDNKLKTNNLTNFILYHESAITRDICSFSKLEDNKYSLVCHYPLSPLQAFIAAVTANVPVSS